MRGDIVKQPPGVELSGNDVKQRSSKEHELLPHHMCAPNMSKINTAPRICYCTYIFARLTHTHILPGSLCDAVVRPLAAPLASFVALDGAILLFPFSSVPALTNPPASRLLLVMESVLLPPSTWWTGV